MKEPGLVENYRSISLLSIPGKCQEHIVHTVIIYSHDSAYLTDWQHGFVKGRSLFNRVPYNVLLHKLCNLGISGKLLNCCKDYLSNRTQRVAIDGYSSSFLEITSGVPQGSILGPLFCNFHD